MKTESSPYFSVIVPCYNVEKSVLPTLECLRTQTFTDFEVILVNDGSTDGTQDILEEFKLIQKKYILLQSNKGLGAARNSGIKICKGEYLALLDADDIWTDNKLKEVHNFITHNGGDVICHNEYVVNERLEVFKKNYYGPYTSYSDLFFKNNCLSPSAVTLKRCVIEKVNYFTEDLNLHGVEDYDLWLKIARSSIEIQYMPDFLGSYVIHGQNMSMDSKFFDKMEYLHIVHSDNIDLKNTCTIIRYKIKLSKLYYLKIRAVLLKKMFKENIQIAKDLLLLIFSLEKYISKKRIELGS